VSSSSTLGLRNVRLHSCSRGAVAVITAMVLPLLLGFTALGVEVGHWYLTKRVMQGAADAAAISATAQYIQDLIARNTSSTAYQTVGQSYASLNGFTIPTSNVCLITADSDNCDAVRSLDSRPIICSAPPCIVVEITQNTFEWLTTQTSVRPTGTIGEVQVIPTPTLLARAVISVVLDLTNSTTGTSCILALANARNAIQARGQGNIKANCGLLIDGGRDQNVDNSTTCSDGTTPPCGGLTLSGSNAAVHITNLTVASSTAGPAGSSCVDPRCFLYDPEDTVLPASAIFTDVASPDPFADRIFTKPAGVVITAATIADGGSGYTPGTAQTFTIEGGTFTAPAKFTANVNSSGTITGTPVLIDPGQYTVLPSPTPISVSGPGAPTRMATFNISSGDCLPGASFASLTAGTRQPLPGRAYCSIPVTGSETFPSGVYYVEGGDSTCIGLCISGNGTISGTGVTFVLTNVTGGASYARFSVSGNNTLNFSAPTSNINANGSACASGCENTTFGMIIFQDRNATETTSVDIAGVVTPPDTLNSLAGCGNDPICRTLSGAIYLPKQTLNFAGNGIVQGTCFGLVSKYLDVAGNPEFQNGCLPGTTGGGGGSGTVTGGTMRLSQ
jgi:Flp pilus assembly protein TadG